MKNLNSVLLRVFIALFLCALLTLLFLHQETPYTAEIVSKRSFTREKATYFLDLNEDGRSERILLSKPTPKQTGLVVYDENENIIDQFNLPGAYVKKSEIFAGDYDRNGLSELYIFTYLGDSLFINVLDIYNVSQPLIARKYIEGCKIIDGVAEYMIIGSYHQDMNEDGLDEFYFAITAGFTLSPRAVYFYDINNDVVRRSQVSGSGPRYYLNAFDLDRDGSLEFWGENNAVGNYKTSIPYTDNSAWLIIYSEKLDFEFEPVEFKGFTSVISTKVFEKKDENQLLVTRKISQKNDSVCNEVYLFSLKGELLEFRELREYDLSHYIESYVYGNRIYIIDNNGKGLIFNEDLVLLRKFKKEWLSGAFYRPSILTPEGDRMILTLDLNGILTVFSPDLKKLATLILDDMAGNRKDPVFVSNSESETGFHLRTFNYDYLISFEANTGRNFVYLYSFLIFIVLYIFIAFIQMLQLKQERKRQETENRLRTLQLQAVKSQMSPHFIFNALNSISAMYIKGDTARADSFLTSFSKMIREVLDSSDRLIVELNEEVKFVQNYLELEQVRHGDKLTFSIDVPKECSMVQIPSMSIHTFVENSIKHGFRGRKKLEVNIAVNCLNEQVNISIRDNGIGYNKTRKEDGRVGKGLNMIREIFDTYYAISGKKIEYSLTDLEEIDSNENSGSLVKISVQL